MQLRTIRLIAAKDVRQWRRQHWLSIGFVLFLLFEFAVCWQTFHGLREDRVSQIHQQHLGRESWLAQETSNAHLATHRGTTLFKVPSPLAGFDPGVDPALGASLPIQAHRPGEMGAPSSDAQNSLLKLEASTPAVLMQMVFPLLVILLSHAGVTREREQGTLLLSQSMGLRWPTLIAGKLLAIGGIITLAMLPSGGILFLSGFETNVVEQMSLWNVSLRATAIIVTLWLYLFGWGALSLAISARSSSSRAALILLVLLWSGWTVVVPRVALDTAQARVPLPTAEEVRDRRSKVASQSDGESSGLGQRLETLQRRLLETHGVDRVRDLPVSFASAKMMEIEKYTDEQFERIQTELDNRFRQQDRMVERFAAISPYLAVRAISMAFAGTDRRHHEDFLDAAEEYRRALVRTMNLADMQKLQPGESRQEKRAFWGQVPPFRHTLPEGIQVAQVAVWPLSMLLAWIGFSCLLALLPPLRWTSKWKGQGVRTALQIPVTAEWSLALRDPACRLTLGILAVLTALACQPGLHHFHARQEMSKRLEVRNETAQRILEAVFSPDKDLKSILGEEESGFSLQEAQDLKLAAHSPDLLAHYDGLWWTWMEPSPLSVLAIGESTTWPDRYRISASSHTETLRRDILENPFHTRVGPFDLTLFIAAILPLGILVLTHGMISLEREQGTLALLISQSVSPFRLFSRHCLIRVSAAVMVIITVTFVVCWCQGCNLAQPEARIPFLLWGCSMFLYALFWGMLGLVVNTFGGSTSTNAIWLLLCWIGLVLMIPVIATQQAVHRNPVSEFSELAEKEREILERCKQKSAESDPTLDPGDAPASAVSLTPQQESFRYWSIHEEAAGQFHTILQNDLNQHLSRERSVDGCGWLSPVIAWRQGAVQLAGTSQSEMVTFVEQTNQFQRDTFSFFKPLSVAERDLTLADIQQIPRYEPEQRNNSLQSHYHSSRLSVLITILLAWNSVLFLVAAFRIRRGIAVK